MLPVIAVAAALRPGTLQSEMKESASPIVQELTAENEDPPNISPSPEAQSSSDILNDITIETGDVRDIGTVADGQSKDRESDRQAEGGDSGSQKAGKSLASSRSRGNEVASKQLSERESANSDQNRALKTGDGNQRDLTITGVVTVESGRPKAIEVTVRRIFQRKAYAAPRTSKWIASLLTTPGAEFKLTIPARLLPEKMSREGEWLTVQATADGYGLAAVPIRESADAKNVKLLMRREQLVSGRVLNLEGRPVAGATVKITNAIANESTSMTAWLAAVSKMPRQPKPGMMFNAVSMFDRAEKDAAPRVKGVDMEIPIETFATVTTDNSGRFQLTGVGTDQILRVEISGPSIARTTVPVIARSLKSGDSAAESPLHIGGENHYGSTFDFIAAPSAPVTGIVRDKDSQEPISGLTIAVTGLAGSPMSRFGWMTTKTDRNGRYTLEGLPTAAESKRFPNRFTVIATDKPYIQTDFRLPSSPGSDPIEFNPELRKAVLAAGQVTDRATGEPVLASLFYTPFSGNPANANYKRYSDEIRHFLGNDRTFVTDANGRFRIPVIPGRGVIGVICNRNSFCSAVGIETIPEFLSPTLRETGYVTNDFMYAQNMHIVKAIDVPDGQDTFNVDLQADAGKTCTLDLVPINADGSNFKGKLWVEGAHARLGGSVSTRERRVQITGLKNEEQRRVFIHDEQSTIGAVIEVTAKRKNVKMVVPPLATVKGQLVGIRKRPLKQRMVTAVVPETRFFRVVDPVQTNDDGRFTLKVPVGGPFDIMTEIKPGTKNARPVKVKSGLSIKDTTVDIGVIGLPTEIKKKDDVDAKALNPKTPDETVAARTDVKAGKPKSTKEELRQKGITRFTGRVLDHTSQPVAGARVRLDGLFQESDETMFWAVAEGLTLPLNSQTFCETITDADGTYTLDHEWRHKQSFIPKGKSRLYSQTSLIVTSTDGRSVWEEEYPAHQSETFEFRLPSKTPPLNGTVVGLEGQPIAGAQVEVVAVASAGDRVDEWLTKIAELTRQGVLPLAPNTDRMMRQSPDVKEASFPAHNWIRGEQLGIRKSMTDSSGRFKIAGVGRDQLAVIRIRKDGLATTFASVLNREMSPVNAGPPDLRSAGFRLGTQYQGNRFSVVVTEGHLVTGRVIDSKTRRPIPNLAVGILREEATFTNANGEFQIAGMTETASSLQVYPASDVPYFPLRLEFNVSKKVEVALRRGIWVNTRVFNQADTKPVEGLQIHYTPLLKNPHSDDYQYYNRDVQRIITNSDRFITDGDGFVRVLGIPGKGVVMASLEPRWPSKLQLRSSVGTSEFEALRKKGERWVTYDSVNPAFLSSLAVVDVSETEAVDLVLPVDSGRTVSVAVKDSKGNDVSDFLVSGHQRPVPTAPRFSIKEPTVKVSALGEDEVRIVMFRDANRKLGLATLVDAAADKDGKTVQLQPLGTISGKLVDRNGDPVVRARIRFMYVKPDAVIGSFITILDDLFTDKEGRFSNDRVLPGAQWRVVCQTSNPRRFRELAASVEVQPGKTVDLGVQNVDLKDDAIKTARK